ncbi:MAG TPA: formylglycine-generating enzyme family protein, partial [Planctomycetaceae bacterium]|nr:formylglycine-generating enzyme family protein [Planctomycetaceae bacterium]
AIAEGVAAPSEGRATTANRSRAPKATPECRAPSWPFDSAEAKRRQVETAKRLGRPVELVIELPGDLKLAFVLIPAGEFIMGTVDGPADERPPHRVRIERPFYMSRTEVTNAQFKALADPHHFSGYAQWRSIDQRGQGYPLFEPDQPVVRVSWHQAMAFCRALAERSGRRVTLPTEAQWEWACRAGSDSPLWYGTPDDDFSPFENLAGHEQVRFAFHGKRKWYLRDDRFDDGRLVSAPVGSYRSNPWGLVDMAGNVCEWTRTTYRPYPYDPSDGRNATSLSGDSSVEKVVRGGSWYLPPRFARSAWRWKYPPWRKVFNVGFRVIIELPMDIAVTQQD